MRSMGNYFVRRTIGFALGATAALSLAFSAGAQARSAGQGSGRGRHSEGVSGGVLGGVGGGISGGVGGGIGWGVTGGIGQGLGIGALDADLEGVGSLLDSVGASLEAGGKSLEIAGPRLGWVGDFDAVEFESQDRGGSDSDKARADHETQLYNEGSRALNDTKYDRAVEIFDQVAQMKGNKADAALHWKAWALNKEGKRAEALTTIAELERDYPKSKWIDDAKSIEIEIRQKSGQTVSPDLESDCELKLMAINGLQQADPAKAVPLLEKMLHSPDCLKVRQQALFVLAQSNSPEAHALMIKLARGEANPALQQKAIQALGIYSGSAGREALAQIYSSSSDIDTKKTVLQALMQSGDKTQMLNAAKTEKDPALRAEAIRLLGQMGAKEEVWQMYQNETSVEVKKQILQAMWLAGDRQRVGDLAMKETDHSLRLAAINDLGLMGRDSNTTLANIYNSDPDPEIRKKVLNAIFLSGDREQMGKLAMSEKDHSLRLSAINYLGLMGRESNSILANIYSSDPDPEIRKKVLNAVFLSGDRERMGELAKHEKDHSLRLSAINYLGLMGKESDGTLVEIYNSDPDTEIRKKVINALFLAGDAKSMVEIARKETDPTLKKAIISQLSIMGNNKDAMEYLMEILNK
ncbi:MAG TPA: HEAT repeat domain-containing protein [Candidatus Acidoferrales bacterium]|nr:HEAT repeat domain-containing protein [Candidatus Acidoferrales bacterium]